MSLLAAIAQWQEDALKIAPPSGTGLLPAIGGVRGPAFFPEGLGLSQAGLGRNDHPTIIAVGHNFGCQEYRNGIQSEVGEEKNATWRNLDQLLNRAGSSPDQCFRTNWFVGLLPGTKQTGCFLRKPDHDYEQACLSLLAKQIHGIKPKAILLLGSEVSSRAHGLIPALAPWHGAKRWIDIDHSVIGHSVRNVEVPAARLRTNVVALLHPSFGTVNQKRRMKNMRIQTTEAEIIRAALA